MDGAFERLGGERLVFLADMAVGIACSSRPPGATHPQAIDSKIGFCPVKAIEIRPEK
jgi:hypothetical protein